MDKEEKHELSKKRFKAVGYDLLAFVRTVVMAIVLGIAVGAYASAFALLIDFLTGVRGQYSWLLFLLPVGGLAIVGFYHLLKAKEMLGLRLLVLHNLYFYNTMMEEIREAIEQGRFSEYKKDKLDKIGGKDNG